MARPRRWRRWLARGLGFVSLGLGGLALLGLAGAAGFWLWLRTPAGNAFIQRKAESTVDGMLVEGDLALGGLQTNVWSRLALTGVSLTRADGTPVIAADTLEVRLDPWSLLGTPHVRLVDGDGLVVDLVMGEDGLLEIQRMFGATEPAPPSGEPWAGLDLLVDAVAVRDSEFRYRQPGVDVHLDDVALSGAVQSAGRRLEARDLEVSARLLAPAETEVRLRGAGAYTGDGVELAGLLVELPDSRAHASGALTGLEGRELGAELVLDVERLALSDVDAFAGVGLGGHFGGTLRVEGPLSALGVSGALEGQEGTTGALGIDATANLGAADIPWSARLDAREVHVGHVMPALGDEIALSGVLDAQGSGTSWPDGLEVSGTYTGTTHEVYGVHLDKLTGDLRLAEGVLHLDRARAEGPLAKLDLDGTVDLDKGPMDVRARGPVRLEDLAAFGVEDLGGRGTVDARVIGDTRAEGVPLRIVGTASLAPVRYGSDITVARAEARYTVDVAHGVIDVVASWRGWEADTYGAQLADLAGERIAVHVAPDGTTHVEGIAEVRGITYPDYAHVGSTEVEYTVDLPATGEMAVWARGRTGPFDVLEFPGTRGAYELRLVGDGLRFHADLYDGSRSFLDAAGSFDIATSTAHLDHLALSPTPRQQWEATEPVHLRLTEDGGIADALVALTSPLDEEGVPVLGAIRVEGTLGTAGPLDGWVSVERLQLDTVAELFPVQAGGLSGVLDLDVYLQGTGADPDLTASVKARQVWVPGFSRWLDLSGSVEASGGTVRPALLLGVAGEGVATAHGTIPAHLDLSGPALDPRGQVDLRLALQRGELYRLERLVPDLDLPSGRMSAAVGITGVLSDPDLHLGGIAELDVAGWRLPFRVEFEADRAGGQLDWYADTREGFKLLGSTGGTGHTRLGEVTTWALDAGPEPDLSDPAVYLDELYGGLWLEAVPIRRLAAATGTVFDADGVLKGGAVVTGAVMKPRVELDLQAAQLRLGEVDVERAEVRLTHRDEGGYSLFAELVLPEGAGGLAVVGDVPLEPDLNAERETWVVGDIDLDIGGPGLPLALARAYDQGIVAADGLLRLEGQLTGSPLAPTPDLTLRLDGGTLAYEPLGLVYRDVYLDLEARRDQVVLENFSLRAEPLDKAFLVGATQRSLLEFGRDLGQETVDALGGAQGKEQTDAERIQKAHLRIKGSTRLDGYTPAATHVAAKLKKAWLIATEQQSAQLSGEVVADGRWPALGITGDLTVNSAHIDADTAYWLEMGSLEVHPGIRVHRAEAEGLRDAVAKDEVARPPIYADFDVGVRVDLNRSTTMRVKMPFIDDFGAIGASATSAEVSTRLDGDVTVAMRGGELGVHGSVDVLDGDVSVLVSKLALDRGTISFAGPDFSNPYLDLDASMAVGTGGKGLRLHVGGTPEAPEIDFSSEDFPDKSQIMMVLLTGKDPENLDSGQGLGALAELVGRGVLGTTGIDQVSYDARGALRLGMPISSRWGVEWMWAPGRQSLDDNQYELGTEFQVIDGLLLSGTYGNRKAWANVFLERRFD